MTRPTCPTCGSSPTRACRDPFHDTKPPASEQRCEAIGSGSHPCALAPGHDGFHRCAKKWCCQWIPFTVTGNLPTPAPPEQPARGDGVRRVFEGIARVYDKQYGPSHIAIDRGDGKESSDFDWFGYPEKKVDGKRVRLTVEVLDDAPGKDGAK